jgi:hypothetical protein
MKKEVCYEMKVSEAIDRFIGYHEVNSKKNHHPQL